jgi:hypothetical protein
VKRFALLLVCAVAIGVPAFLAVAEDKSTSKDASKPDADGFYSLFDGKSLNGWHVNENPETFKVEDGKIVVNGKASHAFYEGPVMNHQFKNFHFKAEVMCFPKSNSGIYFHTKYQEHGFPQVGFEAQVNNTHGDPKKTGGLYNVKDVMNNSPAKDNEWFKYEIIVKGNDVKILIDGKPATEWTQPADWKGAGKQAERRIQPGTFALQGHDPGSKVLYKNIMVKPLD